MLEVTFTVADTGATYVVDASGHSTLMQVAVDNDVPYIEGECGGEMTCGTCHVHVEWMPEGYVAELGSDEVDMLEVVNEPVAASRLSCQLPVNEQVAGLQLRVPTP